MCVNTHIRALFRVTVVERDNNIKLFNVGAIVGAISQIRKS